MAYVKDAQWVEAPQRLFQRLLSETVAARTNRVILDEGQYLTAPGEQLAGQLLDFGVDEATNEAVVVYQAMLAGAGGKSVTGPLRGARADRRRTDGHRVGERRGHSWRHRTTPRP